MKTRLLSLAFIPLLIPPILRGCGDTSPPPPAGPHSSNCQEFVCEPLWVIVQQDGSAHIVDAEGYAIYVIPNERVWGKYDP